MFNYQNYGLIEELPSGAAPALILGWQWGVDDFNPRPARIFEQGPALVLTPATLPAPIAGMAWLAPPDRDVPPRRPLVEQPAAWDTQPIIVSAAVPQGWQTVAPELRGRAPAPLEVPATPPPMAPPAPATGWWHGDDDFPRRRPVSLDVAAFTPPIVPAVGVSGIGWFNPPDRDPPLRRPLIEQPPALVLTPATLPVKVSGMGWFQPPDDLPRKWKPLFDLPAWDAQIQGQIVVGISGMAWFLPPEERRPLVWRPSDAVAFVSPAPVAAAFGWWSPATDLLRKAAPVDAPPALPPPLPVQPAGWLDLIDDRPPFKARLVQDYPAQVLFPPVPPTPISGMAWFMPLDELPRKWKPLSDLPAWDPRFIVPTFLIANPEYIVGYSNIPKRVLGYRAIPIRKVPTSVS